MCILRRKYSLIKYLFYYLIGGSLKKIVVRYLNEFLEDNSVFYSYQFGFWKSNSTSHAIITLVERISKALDMGKYVVGVVLDL